MPILAKMAWDWSQPGPKGQTKLSTVEDHLYWTYAMLAVCRRIMNDLAAGKPHPFPDGRTKAANIHMANYRAGKKTISNLDRDNILAQTGIACCCHCGTIADDYHWDHLIPRHTLRGGHLDLNQVRSCPHCNTSRGKKDLLDWHRQRQTFPSLAILRRYMKLCFIHAQKHGLLDRPAMDAVADGFPFRPDLLPRKFPAVECLVWDHAHPGKP
jgi:hypothetical protein